MQEVNQSQRPSRYRSQRRPTVGTDQAPEIPPPNTAAENSSVARSKSRYHRRQNESASSPNDTAPPPPPLSRSRYRDVAPLKKPSSPDSIPEDNERTITSPISPLRPHFQPSHQTTLPNGELFPPPKPAELPLSDGPPASSSIQATSSEVRPTKSEDDDTSRAAAVLGLFKRKRGETTASKASSVDKQPTTAAETVDPAALVGTDAPKSAVNAGDRQVLVECGQSKIYLPVTPLTTPVDIIRSCETCLSERINLVSAVLLEQFGTVGVQRPLRRYERVRDVLNSWDHDQQNSLLLVDPQVGQSEPELSLAGVPKVKPKEQSWTLCYSQKVGKWDVRVITLRGDGQIISQKENAKANDFVNVCHLSDFDIYTPSKERLKKKIKPPRKHCFAIKSQQKTAMFESTDNFVHFFCVQDSGTADKFYRAVHSWRCWYLVNVMGEGKPAQLLPSTSNPALLPASVREAVSRHQKSDSISSHYQLGTFQPLVDLDQLAQKLDNIKVEDPQAHGGGMKAVPILEQFDAARSAARRQPTVRRQRAPTTTKAKEVLKDDEPLGKLRQRPSNRRHRAPSEQRQPESHEFSSKGLLGEKYVQRQREIMEREKQSEQPFVGGATLLGGHISSGEVGIGRQKSLRRQDSATYGADMSRGGSGGEGAGGGNRVLDRSAPVPSRQRDSIDSARFRPDPSRPLVDQTATATTTAAAAASVPRAAHGDEAFTGEGLLAGSHARQGWGGADRGRGVMDGSRAGGKPMLSVRDPSQFVQGSLLDRVELEQAPGGRGPVIDREKRVERWEKTGEGL